MSKKMMIGLLSLAFLAGLGANASAALVSVSSSTIKQLTAFTSDNGNPDALIVILDGAPLKCPPSAIKDGYHLDVSANKNQAAAALLHAAFLNGRGVGLELDDGKTVQGRCKIVSVSVR